MSFLEIGNVLENLTGELCHATLEEPVKREDGKQSKANGKQW